MPVRLSLKPSNGFVAAKSRALVGKCSLGRFCGFVGDVWDCCASLPPC